MAEWVNTVGLLCNITGVVIAFYYGYPRRHPREIAACSRRDKVARPHTGEILQMRGGPRDGVRGELAHPSSRDQLARASLASVQGVALVFPKGQMYCRDPLLKHLLA